ncbi:hypothetical protein ES705_15937 [subsurface metagenome]
MFEKGFFTKLDEQFSLGISTDSKEDFIKILELNVAVHGEEIKEYIKRIYKEHPKKKDILWFYIEDNSTGQILSSITLLPLEWQFEGKLLSVCEMGFVGTLKEYRGNGLISKLNEFYERVMMERGYLLSCLRGIPYYYRRFVYEFVLSLDERFSLSPNQIPSIELSHIDIRKATRKDIGYIENQYNSNSNSFLISNNFDTESFYFKFMNDSFNDNKLSAYIIEENGKPEGYFLIGMSFDNEVYTIITPQLSPPQMIKLLQHINEYPKKEKDLNLNVAEFSGFGKYLFSIGKLQSNYGWQIKIPNLKQFFESIKDILENRVKKSKFNDLSKTVIISDYKQSIELIFVKGKIEAIKIESGYPDVEKCDVRIPGAMLLKLLLGDRTVDEINYIVKDARINPSSKKLIEILFPKVNSIPDTYY